MNDRIRVRLGNGLTENKSVNRIKKGFKDDYFKLTLLYLIIYTVSYFILVHGIEYLISGCVDFTSLRSIVIIGFTSLSTVMAIMIKKLKDDIVSNYWKLKRIRPKK